LLEYINLLISIYFYIGDHFSIYRTKIELKKKEEEEARSLVD